MSAPKVYKTDEDHRNDTYTAETQCRDCGETHKVTLPGPGLFAYNRGELVQVAFPNLSADERELFFMSGVCGKCYDKLFSFDTDSEEE